MADNLEEQKTKRFNESIGDKLYHYTSFLALKGILQNKEFWFGSLYNMNDNQEVTAYITKLKETLELSNTNKKTVKRLFRQIEIERSNFYPFALSLSCNKDDAAMWERYAQNAEGVCIVFNTEKLNQLFQTESNYVLCRELYDIDPHGEMISRVKDFCDGRSAMSEEYMVRLILLFACSFKHESFRSENEVRIFTSSNLQLDSTVTYGFIEEPKKIKKILKAHIVEICEKQKIDTSAIMNELIDQIVIGPRSSTTEDDLRDYIVNIINITSNPSHGLDALSEKISKSDCTLR